MYVYVRDYVLINVLPQVDSVYHHPSLGVHINIVVVKVVIMDDSQVSSLLEVYRISLVIQIIYLVLFYIGILTKTNNK